ncbi:hypothetical protein ACWGLF_27575 [Streptomyces puniciscabiei]
MTVSILLESLPDIGKVQAKKLPREMEISESRRVRGLGIEQRDRLLERFAPQGSAASWRVTTTLRGRFLKAAKLSGVRTCQACWQDCWLSR